MKIGLITSASDQFIADMVCRFKEVDGITFDDIVFWNRQQPALKKIRYNLKKSGPIYLPYRLGLLALNSVKQVLGRPIAKYFLADEVTTDLFEVCRKHNITIHEIDNVHSSEGIALVESLDLDLLMVCGTGILKSSVFDLPAKGTVNLHQGDVGKYKGAPPGFWEQWNNADEIGVTIHFINAGVDTGDVIDQKIVPIFPYDTLASLQNKVAEISLDLYPKVLQRLVTGEYTRTKQKKGAGKQYFFPTLTERFKLWAKVMKRTVDPVRIVMRPVKAMLFLFLLQLINLRDLILLRRGETIVSVLYYHRISDICHDGMTTSRALFENQIRFLKKRYEIISASDVDDIIAGKDHGFKGKKCCLITFDDGYLDNYTNALPILTKYDCPAVFFISTGMISNDRQFLHDKEVEPLLSFEKMSWEQLRKAEQANITIGVHTHTHINLGTSSNEETAREIAASIEEYRKHLNHDPFCMSFPFGQKSDIRLEQIEYIRKQPAIKLLFSAYGGKNFHPFNRYDIKRSNVSFEKSFEFWMRVEGHIKTLLKPNDSITVE